MKSSQREAVRQILMSSFASHHEQIFEHDLISAFDLDIEQALADSHMMERAEMAKSGSHKLNNILYRDQFWWVRLIVAEVSDITILKKMVNDSSAAVQAALRNRDIPELTALMNKTESEQPNHDRDRT